MFEPEKSSEDRLYLTKRAQSESKTNNSDLGTSPDMNLKRNQSSYPKAGAKKRGRKSKRSMMLERVQTDNPLEAMISQVDVTVTKKCKSFVHDGEVYKAGENVLVFNKDNYEFPYIGKIICLKIMASKKRKYEFAAVKIKWYFTKYDLGQKFQKNEKNFSEKELFLSDFTEHVAPEVLQGKCTVYTFEEFEQLTTDLDIKSFFTRAKFMTVGGLIEPPVSSWPKQCICKTPMNPDLHYIYCEHCKTWFHLTCMGITKEEADNMVGDYICPDCLKKLEKEKEKV